MSKHTCQIKTKISHTKSNQLIKQDKNKVQLVILNYEFIHAMNALGIF